MTTEQLEFAISQYLDGALSPEETAALEERLAADPVAHLLCQEYRSLEGKVLKAIRAARPVPPIQWERLAEMISAALTAQAAKSSELPITEEFEFALTQFLDGDQSSEARGAIEERLISDPGAARLAEEYRSLDLLLKDVPPLPQVQWERFADRVSQAVADMDEAADEQADAGQRIPLQSSGAVTGQRDSWYSITTWLHHSPRLAMAACLLISIGLAAYLMFWHTSTRLDGRHSAVAEVIMAGPEPLAGAAVLEVNVVDEPQAVASRQLDEYSPGVVSVPSRLLIAENTPSYRDEPASLY